MNVSPHSSQDAKLTKIGFFKRGSFFFLSKYNNAWKFLFEKWENIDSRSFFQSSIDRCYLQNWSKIFCHQARNPPFLERFLFMFDNHLILLNIYLLVCKSKSIDYILTWKFIISFQLKEYIISGLQLIVSFDLLFSQPLIKQGTIPIK